MSERTDVNSLAALSSPQSSSRVEWFSILLAMLFTTACNSNMPDEGGVGPAQEGAADEPETQQFQRRLRQPYLDALRPGDLFNDINIFPPLGEPPEEGNKPYPVKTIVITGRTNSSISMRWHDRSSVEDGTRVRRRVGLAGGWQDVFTYGPTAGFTDFTEDGLDSDEYYCYQFLAFNEHGESASPQKCAFTQGDDVQPVFRAQLRLKTADVSDAGTDNRVHVRLNSPPGIALPAGNVTVMDYGQDDFERGDDFTYDLELSSLENLTDVTLLSLSKDGDNGWCIESLELLIDNTSVYTQEFGSTADTCQWLDDDGGDSRTFTVFHEALRVHPAWQAFTPTESPIIPREEIESRVEGMVGHLLSATQRAKWGDRNGRAWVEAVRKNDETVHIDLDLEAEVPYFFNASLDMDFDLTFRFANRSGEWEMDILTSNLEVSADYNWFLEVISFLIPCGPIVSIVADEGIPDCISGLEHYIEDKARSGWQPIARHFAIENPCPLDFRPAATVTERPDVRFGCEEDESAPNIL